MRQKYRIVAKTPLVVLDEGKDNKITDENDQGFTYEQRVKVAIVIDSGWDKGQLVPTAPGCHLTTEGKFPPIVSVECPSSSGRKSTPHAPKSPYQEGVHDYYKGLCYRGRPYSEGPADKDAQWEKGFRDAQKRDHDRVDRSYCYPEG
jgi:hypothetical protein